MSDPMNELRQCHYIKAISGNSAPSNMVFVDVATIAARMPGTRIREVHSLRLWVACHLRMSGGTVVRETWRYGTHPETFWDYLESCHEKKKKTYVFGHNIGHDLSCLCYWQLLEEGGYKLYSRLAKDASGQHASMSANTLTDPPTIIDSVHRDSNTRVVMCDIANYFPVGMDELAKVVGIPRMVIEDGVDDLDVWIPKVKVDCRIVIETVLSLVRMWRREKLGNFKLTAAGLSYEAYRSRFMAHKLMVHGHKLSLELERKCYYGGICDVRFVGQIGTDVWDSQYTARSLVATPMPRLYGQVYVLDVNSMYPYVMRGNRFPTRLLGYYPNSAIVLGDSKRDGNNCSAWVRLDSGNDSYPKKIGENTRWCRGRFTTHLCGPELYRALRSGHVIDILAWSNYDMEPIFTDFVDYFWDRRQTARSKSDNGMQLFYKLVLNSLTGKWAQRLPRWTHRDDITSPQDWGTYYVFDRDRGRLVACRSVGGHCFWETDRGEGSQSIPIISAYITGYAREYLRSLIDVSGRDNVYYYDTDSLHVSGDGYDRLKGMGYIDDKKLGSLKVVGVYDYAEYRGVKDYTLDDAHTIAGKRPDSVLRTDHSYSQLERQRLFTLTSARPNGTIVVSEVYKRVGLTHVNGTVDRHGWVSPITLKEF